MARAASSLTPGALAETPEPRPSSPSCDKDLVWWCAVPRSPFGSVRSDTSVGHRHCHTAKVNSGCRPRLIGAEATIVAIASRYNGTAAAFCCNVWGLDSFSQKYWKMSRTSRWSSSGVSNVLRDPNSVSISVSVIVVDICWEGKKDRSQGRRTKLKLEDLRLKPVIQTKLICRVLLFAIFRNFFKLLTLSFDWEQIQLFASYWFSDFQILCSASHSAFQVWFLLNCFYPFFVISPRSVLRPFHLKMNLIWTSARTVPQSKLELYWFEHWCSHATPNECRELPRPEISDRTEVTVTETLLNSNLWVFVAAEATRCWSLSTNSFWHRSVLASWLILLVVGH